MWTKMIVLYNSFLWRIQKIISPFFRLPMIPNPILFMTLLVRNEEDIIEENILFHKEMGVDGFIVTDNNSTDKTLQILQKYKDKGWIKEIIIEKDNNYDQQKWVNRMIKLAKKKYNADWIINADADEFWYTPVGNYKEELSHIKSNIIRCPLMNIIPMEGQHFSEWDNVVAMQLDKPEKIGLSKFSVYNIQYPKVIHRTSGFKTIYMGNHGVKIIPVKIQQNTNIIIYHYPVRGFEHFLRKVKIGGQALLNNSNLQGGTHWRMLYNIYLEGHLFEEYKKVIGYDKLDELSNEGIVKKDKTISIVLNEFVNAVKKTKDGGR